MKIIRSILKSAIPVAAVKIVVLMGIAVLLSQCISRELQERNLDYMELMNNALSDNLKSRQDGYIRVLHTLANIMADYENIPAGERRGRYNDILPAVLKSESDIAALYTIWKPNAIDGMDSRYIGIHGSSSAGQYAVSFIRDIDQVHRQTVANEDIDTVMEYLNGLDSKKDHVEEPIFGQLNGKDTYFIRMSVPIINSRTNETTGIVGCLLSIDTIQLFVEESLWDNFEIAAMTIYSNNGFIMGSFVPDRVGKYLINVDTIYGEHIEEAEQAVIEGMVFYCTSYSPILATNVRIFMTPFQIGNSNTTWSVMIAATEEYFKRRSFLSFR